MSAGEPTAHWLVSYPKSGNTWLRWFLASYAAGGESVSINALVSTYSPAARALVDARLGFDSADLTPAEVDPFRAEALRRLVTGSAEPIWFKVHEGYRRFADGSSLLHAELCHRVALVVRDPRDIAASYAHFAGVSISTAVDWLCDPGHALPEYNDGISAELRTLVGDWSAHTRSWLENAVAAPLLLRYEDLLDQPLRCFGRLVVHFGMQLDSDVLARAVASTGFSNAVSWEKREGFGESLASRPFFRRGQRRGWRAELAPDDAERIVTTHRTMMERLGYLVEP